MQVLGGPRRSSREPRAPPGPACLSLSLPVSARSSHHNPTQAPFTPHPRLGNADLSADPGRSS